MKLYLKKCILTTLSFIMLLSLFGLVIIKVNASSEDNFGDYSQFFETQYGSFSMLDGGYVRPETPVGLRFETVLLKTDKAKLDSKNATFGTIIIPSANLKGDELTLDTPQVLNITTENWLGQRNTFGSEYDGYYGTLIGGTEELPDDIQESYYGTVFSARGYVKFTQNEIEQIIYTKNIIERSIAGIAEKAIEKGNTDQVVKDIYNLTPKITLSYNTNGGNEIQDKTVVLGHVLTAPENPTKEGCVFLGWYEDELLTIPFEFNGVITENTTVYAKWLDLNLVKDGVSDYTIVTPDNLKEYEDTAVSELTKYFKQATGITLSAITESEASVNQGSKYIVVGDTELAKQEGIIASSATLGYRGYKIKTIDSNVYLVGGGDIGTLNAVYGFLTRQFNLEAYAGDEIYIDTGVINQMLNSYDLEDVPDIAYLESTGKYRDTEKIDQGLSMGYNYYTDTFIQVKDEGGALAQPWHNTFAYVNNWRYHHEDNGLDSYKPNWFVSDGGNTANSAKQLHYTAHGNEQDLEELRDLVFSRMVQFIEEDFALGNYRELIGFMQEDGNDWGTDERYTEMYGDAAPAAMLIDFINPIAVRLKEYMAENHPGRNMTIVVFAYMKTEKAPVKVVENNYVAINDLKLESNVAVMLAPIVADYTKEYEYNEISSNTEIDTLIKQWNVIADNMAFWFYGGYFANTAIYYDNVYNLKGLYQAVKEAKAQYLFNEMTSNDTTIFPMADLKLYLNSKLSWNADANIDTLISNFFTNYYKEASTQMRRYFDTLVNRTGSYDSNTFGIAGAETLHYDNSTLWDKTTVDTLISYINGAIDAIETLKLTNLELYNKLYDRILEESLSPRYLQLKHHANTSFASEDLFNQAVASFKADCEKLGKVKYGWANSGYEISNLVFSYA